MTNVTLSPARAEPGRRQALLDVGLDLFSHTPFDELSIDDIAARAGVAKGLLYYYFGSKRGFYVACVEHATAELRRIEEAALDGLPARERLFAGLDAYLDYVAGHSAGFVTIMAGGVGADREVRTILEREHEHRVALMCDELAATDPPSPILLTALRGWIGYVEAVSLQWIAAGTLDRDTVREVLLRSFPGVLRAVRDLDADALNARGLTLAG